MKFKLTSSQNNFYNKNFTLDSHIWNQGVMQVFPKVYTYDELNNAYNSLVKAHDSLRVKLVETPDGVMADVKEHEHINYRFWQVETEEELMQKAQDFLNEPTDRYGLLVDCAVFQTPVSSGIMINAHHIVVDGFSAFVMSEHVNNFLKDEGFEPVIQKYPEYVEKEEKYKQSRRYIKSREFWLNEFSKKPKCDILPVNENTLDFTSEELNSPISAEVFNKVKAFCEKTGITPASFFNTIIATYLHKKHNLECFTIGVPVLNRTTPEELNTIGLYMHLVPLVIALENNSFVDNAKRTEDSQMNLFRHQSFTQQDIKKLLKENNISVNQLFDVVSDYQEFSHNDEYEMKLPYGNSLSVPIEMHIQTFDEDKHNIKIRYRTAFLSKQDAQLMLSSIIALIEDALENPQKNIFELEMISAEEKHILLNDFNDTAHTYNTPEGSTIYGLFEENAKKNKEKLCITANGKTITYGEFLNIAEQLDCEIQKYAKGEKRVIGVIADRSIEMYAAIYGIIRGGNAYMPIAPDYPQDRIEYMLTNSNSPLAVCQGQYCSLAGENCINMTDFIENLPEYEVLPSIATEDDTAYVIYTSGSTGKPKGAKVSHKSAVNRILWMHDFYPLADDGVILQKTPYTFDVSVWELFWWGMLGGSLAASKPNEHFLPAKILEETEKNKITHLHFVPSVFDLFLTYLESNREDCRKFSTVERVFLSGEALSASLVNRFYSLFDYEKVKLHNLYGPTECAVDVTYYDCIPGDCDPVPIGKPIHNTQLHIVDKHLKQTPIGVIGELCIAGVNVGQGYLNNPELTKEKFIDNPFGNGKLYKTGDLAYWREDGNIIFCGRMDNQIKLNGQRIELGEIENVINSIDGIDSCAVTIRKADNRDILVAFCCGCAEITLIKSICGDKLPSYMVPSGFAFIDKLPLNPSGKLDRKLLATLDFHEEKANADPPTNETEKLICKSFGKALGIEEIGINSNFFDLGGTSLSMISVLSESIFENISAPEFIANPTPRLLAKRLNSLDQSQLDFLKPLSVNNGASKALILFPYAGGGAESYAQLVNAFNKKCSDFSLYYVDYLHSYEECKAVAFEIASLKENYMLYFYSHCAGSAVAMQVLNIIEKESLCNIKHYVAGGSIPPKKAPSGNLWNIVPDFILKRVLTNAGADLNKLDKNQLKAMLYNFRKDTDFLAEHLGGAVQRIKSPVSLVMSKHDIFTKQYKNASQLWSKYAENLQYIRFIETKSHYFQSSDCDTLADIVLNIFS